MKVLKRAKQKNFRVNNGMYLERELQDMIDARLIDRPFENELDYRIYADSIEEIKIIYSKEYECYFTVAIPFNDFCDERIPSKVYIEI